MTDTNQYAKIERINLNHVKYIPFLCRDKNNAYGLQKLVIRKKITDYSKFRTKNTNMHTHTHTHTHTQTCAHTQTVRADINVSNINSLNPKRRTLYLSPSPYRAVNTFLFGYKNQSVYAVSGTSRCLFSDKYKTHKFI